MTPNGPVSLCSDTASSKGPQRYAELGKTEVAATGTYLVAFLGAGPNVIPRIQSAPLCGSS